MFGLIEFIEKAIGAPWVNRADSNGEYDCWGLITASFLEVDGVELPAVDGYKSKECTIGKAAIKMLRTGSFKKAQASDGAIMTVTNNKGLITHVGRCMHGRVLHSTERMGVRWETYSAINSQFKNRPNLTLQLSGRDFFWMHVDCRRGQVQGLRAYHIL